VTRIDTEIHIDGPIDAVFDVVASARDWPRWDHEGTWTVVEHVRPARLILQIDSGRIQIGYTFSTDSGSTLLRRELSYRPQDFAGGAADPSALEARMHAHRGEFLGIPASGRAIDDTGLFLLRLEGQRIAEFWAQPDQLGLLKQLGARVVAGEADNMPATAERL
jgi:hypothetical protein